MLNVAIILSGCGVFDGAEIHESVLTMLALEENGAKYQCFAPDITQYKVVNHLNGQEMKESRNVLVESARIARGEVLPVSALKAINFDALIFPGGAGAKINLSNFGLAGKSSQMESDTLKAAKNFVIAKKPIGFICIAPAMIPLIIDQPVQFTIGDDMQTSKAIESIGGVHICCPVNQFVADEKHKIVSTPAYMLANNISQAASGIRKLVTKVLALAGQ